MANMAAWSVIVVLFLICLYFGAIVYRQKQTLKAIYRSKKAEKEALDRLYEFEPYAFVKKPVKIHAVLIADIDEEYGIAIRSRTNGSQELPKWFVDAFNNGDIQVGQKDSEPVLYVKTLEGEHVVRVGMYLIRGVEGELYGCDPKIFEKTYE